MARSGFQAEYSLAPDRGFMDLNTFTATSITASIIGRAITVPILRAVKALRIIELSFTDRQCTTPTVVRLLADININEVRRRAAGMVEGQEV